MLSRVKRRYCKHAICQMCMKIGSVYHASVVRGCVPMCTSSSLIYYFWFLKHHHSAATHHHLCSCKTQLYPWKLHAGRANNNYFLNIFFSFLLYVFGIVFNCIMQNNSYCLHHIFLDNYVRQLHQIIHLSPVGCFTPARGKAVQKNCAVSGVK